MSEYHGVLLASGGLDSTTLYHAFRAQGHRMLPLFLDYGQHCRDTELATLRELLPSDEIGELHVLDISAIYLGSRSRLIAEADLWHEDVTPDDLYLPYRNLLFLSVAAAFAHDRRIPRIYAAFINSNHAKEIDCSTAFFDELGSMLAGYGGVEVCLPFREYAKADVVRLALKLGVSVGRTYSCQIASSVPCGACPNCVERVEALNQVVDETVKAS
jgi:7-cyano-7-deazaguanine synthase